jgi:serine/threonine protein kinase
VIEQVATALGAAHHAELIHGDVKPSNILITPRDFVYLIDFGLARTAGEVGLTTAGSTLGTMAYMAPERFEGKPVDPTSDIYALTCVLYECLTGARPYPAQSLEQQIAGHMTQPIPRPSEIDPSLAAFDEVIAKGMAKKSAKRYQSAGELAAAARRALNAPVRNPGSGRHSARRAAPAKRQVSGRLVAVAVAVAVVLVAGGIGIWQWRGGGDGSEPASMAESSSTATPEPQPGSVESIAATVPDDIRATGRLVIGVNVPMPQTSSKTPAARSSVSTSI